MAKARNRSRGKKNALRVGGAEVRLIRSGKPSAKGKSIRSGVVLVPSGSYKAEDFPALERLRSGSS